MIHSLWRPDLYLEGSIESFTTVINKRNEVFRVSKGGLVDYSFKITTRNVLEMNFKYYPLDSELARLSFGSFYFYSQILTFFQIC